VVGGDRRPGDFLENRRLTISADLAALALMPFASTIYAGTALRMPPHRPPTRSKTAARYMLFHRSSSSQALIEPDPAANPGMGEDKPVSPEHRAVPEWSSRGRH
jgi:hypothetical protein